MKTLIRLFWLCGWLAVIPVQARTISWFSDAEKINRGSSGSVMGGDFQFELGVFTGGFVPTASNVDQWPEHWVMASATTYKSSTRRFLGFFTVIDNNDPFTVGAQAWMFGYRNTATGSERILFRNNSWLWPAPDPMNPIALEWNAKDADIIARGSVNSSGSPFLLQSGALQSYAQWKTENLSGESLAGTSDDPDGDGIPNMLEFAFGTPPGSANAPVSTPVALVGGKLQITIPRRIDRSASLTVEVSGDLVNWTSGPAATTVVTDDDSVLVVRDLTPAESSNPKRFFRVRAAQP